MPEFLNRIGIHIGSAAEDGAVGKITNSAAQNFPDGERAAFLHLLFDLLARKACFCLHVATVSCLASGVRFASAEQKHSILTGDNIRPPLTPPGS